MEGLTTADLLSVLNSQQNKGGFGGENTGFLFLFLLLLFGLGGNGNGLFGGNRNNGAVNGFDVSSLQDIKQMLSTMQIQDGAAWSALQNKFFDLSRQGDQNTAGLMSKLSDCCCQTQRAIDGTNFNIANSTCDIKGAINNSYNGLTSTLTNMRFENQAGQNAIMTAQAADTCKILQAITDSGNNTINYMKCKEIEQLRTDLQSAQLTLSQANQTSTLLDAISSCCPRTSTTTPTA